MVQFYEAILDDIDAPRAWYARNNTFMPHFHESIELVYVLAGRSQAIIDGVHVHAGPGDLIINGSYQVHAYTEQETHVIVAAIPLTAVPQLSEQFVACQFACQVCADDDEGRIGQLMRLLVSFRGSGTALSGISTALLGYLIERVGLLAQSGGSDNDLPRRILSYIGEHYSEPIDSARLALHFGYSRSRLSHLFKASIGYSLPEYLHMVRLRRVAGLLVATSLPLSDIAAQCGYTNMHTFHYAFRGHFGMTPGAYRRAQTPAAKETT